MIFLVKLEELQKLLSGSQGRSQLREDHRHCRLEHPPSRLLLQIPPGSSRRDAPEFRVQCIQACIIIHAVFNLHVTLGPDEFNDYGYWKTLESHRRVFTGIVTWQTCHQSAVDPVWAAAAGGTSKRQAKLASAKSEQPVCRCSF